MQTNYDNPFFFVFGIPILVWIASYLYLVFYYKKWNLLKVKIHESKRYSFLETVFYFNHFLRELPIDTFFALCIFWAYNVTHSNSNGAEPAGNSGLFLTMFILFLLFVFVGSIRRVGLSNSILDFTQFREVDDVIAFGSHWQMHFLSTIVLMFLLILPGTFRESATIWQALVIFIVFLILSMILRTNLRAFKDKRWLMHGAREVTTFFFLAVLPSYVLNLRLDSISLVTTSIIVGLIIVTIMAYYVWVYLDVDVRSLARGDFEVPYLFASHFFEHVLDFGYIILLVGLLINL